VAPDALDPAVTAPLEQEDGVETDKRYGARAYLNGDGVIQIKQTIKDLNDDRGQYVIDYDANGNQRERSVHPGADQDERVGQAVRLALTGMLGPQSASA
jgi:hypothetical protein